MRRIVLALVLLAPALAHAQEWPPPASASPTDLRNAQYWPNDPSYAGDWFIWGFTPAAVQSNANVSAAEKALGIGMAVDQAWQLTVGDPRVVIAEMDSGYNWNEPDLLNKWYLNRRELKPPRRDDCVGTDPYDCNGDGVFNIQDYTTATGHQQPLANTIADLTLRARTDRGDVNGNGFLDPQDLIAIFSDGVDDDGNGFIDDICGWDFMWDDNDPMEDTENGQHEGQGGSHGTGEASDSSAEVNNGIEGEGICPKCLVMPVRVGDSYTGDTNHFALATYYAVNQGASLIQEALGDLTNPALAQDAVNYAYAHQVLVVASAADEASLHHNYPGNLEHTLLMHAVVYDGRNWDSSDTTSFLNFNNCGNWGGHLGLAASATACSSQATGVTSGMAGLILSYGLQLNLTPSLSANELYQVMIESSTDINVPGSATDPTKFESGPGWDARFGYGRNNARAALDMLTAGQIPPEVDIQSPRWFQVFDPIRTGMITIEGSVAANRAPSFDYVVQVAAGLEPRDPDFTMVASGTGTSAMTGASLAQVDITQLLGSANAVITDPHQFAATVRIQATAHYGGTVGDVKGEARKTFFVHRDDDVRTGFPLFLGSSGESSPRFFDLKGDGKDELVLATSDGKLHAFEADGTELAGFPASLGGLREITHHGTAWIDDAGLADQGQGVLSSPAIGDVDGDGKPEIVIGTIDGDLHVIGVDGREKSGFPVTLGDDTLPCEVPSFTQVNHCRYAGIWNPDGGADAGPGGLPLTQIDEVERGFTSSPVLVDMDGDGKLDIVQGGMDGYLHVWNYLGAELPGFPVQLRDARGSLVDGRFATERTRIIDTPAVGDVEGNGKPDVLIGTNEMYDNRTTSRGYLVSNAGAPSLGEFAKAYLPGWPLTLSGLQVEVLPFLGKGTPDSPILADVDKDGTLDLMIHALTGTPQVFDKTGKVKLSLNPNVPLTGGTATSRQGPALPAINSGSLADLDGDGLLEYIDGSLSLLDAEQGISGGVRHDFDHQVSVWALGKAAKFDLANPTGAIDAALLPAFPQQVPDYQFLMNYSVADLDGDGLPEAISASGGYEVTAFNFQGAQPTGWPKLTGGWMIATPAIGDFDGDGYLDVAEVTREGFLWVWKTTGLANGKVLWEGFHHDPQGTGNLATALPVRAGPPAKATPTATTKKKGCGCQVGGDDLALGLFGLGWMIATRSRRAREPKTRGKS